MRQHRMCTARMFGTPTKGFALITALLAGTLGISAQTNLVQGTVFGTNDLSEALSIASQSDGDGSVIVGFAGTTNLTLNNTIGGFVAITNGTEDFTMDATGGSLTRVNGAALIIDGSTNLLLTGGQFIGTDREEGLPPTPGLEGIGGWITNSTATINESEFAGINQTAGLLVWDSDVTLSNVIVRGGNNGNGLVAFGQSDLIIHSGFFTGGVSSTALYLENSDVTVHGGTFVGDLSSDDPIDGAGLFSELTTTTTNAISLYGGTFSSVAFYSTNGGVQQFLAGTNLVIQNGVQQDGGTLIIENLSDDALTDILVRSGDISFISNYTLQANGMFVLEEDDSTATFKDLTVASGATMNIGTASVEVESFTAQSFSTNLLTITPDTFGTINSTSAFFETDSVLLIDASSPGISSSETNSFELITTTADQLFAGTTNSPADATSFTNSVAVDTATSNERTQFLGVEVDTAGAQTTIRFRFTALPFSEYWALSNGTSTVVTEAFANELDQLAGSSMLTAIDSYSTPEASLAAIEQTYFSVPNTFQTILDGMQAAVGQAASRSAEYREQTALKPSGARGPQHQSDLRGWAKYYGQRGQYDAKELNSAFDTDMDGAVIGIDTSIGQSFLIGIAGGYGQYMSDFDTGAEEEITAYHGSLYGTLGIGTAYIDMGAAYGFNDIESHTRAPFDLNAEYEAEVISGYLGGGIDLVDSQEGMIFTPEASIQYTLYEQDGYTEESSISVPRRFSGFDTDSLRSSVGVNLSVEEAIRMETFTFKYDVRFHWLREYNPEPGTMNFALEGGTEGYQLVYPSLEEDYYRAGIGASFSNALRNQPNNVLFRIDFDELFGDNFNIHSFSAKVIYAF